MGNKLAPSQVEACAHAAHEATRAWAKSLGDHSQLPWEQESPEIRSQAMTSVMGVCHFDEDAELSHARWVDNKRALGWQLGPVKDVQKKIHPCLVEWTDLPSEQQFKDEQWVKIIKLMAGSFWRQPA